MKFTVNQGELLEALEATNKAVSDSVIMPILNCFLFKMEGAQGLISASNLELSISRSITVTGEGNIEVCIPAARLIGLIRSLPDQPLTFTFEGTTVTINSVSGKYVIPVSPGEDFPTMSLDGANEVITLPAKDFTNAINKSVFAACNEPLKKTNGFCVDVHPAGVTFTGCNNVILSTQTIKVHNDLTLRFVLPFKSAIALNGITAEGDIAIRIFEKNLSIEFNGTTIRSVLLEDIYPDWRTIVPTDNQIHVSVDKKQLLDSVKRTVQFCDQKTGVITLNLDGNEFKVVGQDVNTGQNAVETIAVQCEEESVSVGINGEMLAQCLNSATDDEVRFLIKDFKTIMIMRAELEAENFILLMPFVV